MTSPTAAEAAELKLFGVSLPDLQGLFDEAGHIQR
jgi:hypothetical protein